MASPGSLEEQNIPKHTKYNYVQLRRYRRLRKHARGVYPKVTEVLGNFGPLVDIGNAEASRKAIAELETKGITGKRREIAMELVKMGFSHAGNELFVKDGTYFVDLKEKEVKRKQKSYPKDTKIPFKKIVIPTSLDFLPNGYLCDYTLKA